MSLRYYANAPATALAASCSNSQTSITVNSVTGFPIQFPYTLILDRGTATEEAVSVTAASGATLTVTRAIDSTTAFAHAIGAVVEHGVTAQDIRESNAHVNASTAVHGLAGAVVGTTDTQTITNKDLTSGNTFPSTLATVSTSQVFTNKDLTSATNTFPSSLVTLTGVQTLTNKTLTSPKLSGTLLDSNGANLLGQSATASAVNYLQAKNAAAAGTPELDAVGTDTNISLNLVSKGTGTVKINGVNAVDLSTAQTLTNKDLSSSTNTFPSAPVVNIYTAGATWTKPSGLKYVVVELVAGGGGGGGCATTAAGECATGGGGGGGGYSKKKILAGTLGATETVTVGAGGTAAANTAGGTGGTSSFGAHASATGGIGGAAGTAIAAPGSSGGQGGAGGTGSTGDLNIAGQKGSIDGFGLNGGRAVPGSGGSSVLGLGANAGMTGTGVTGTTGGNYGGGGSGGANAQSQGTTKAGGVGGGGLVIVTEFYV